MFDMTDTYMADAFSAIFMVVLFALILGGITILGSRSNNKKPKEYDPDEFNAHRERRSQWEEDGKNSLW
jgi:hypothetical protein